jgi:DNA-binding NarL/FixJ family response regulator
MTVRDESPLRVLVVAAAAARRADLAEMVVKAANARAATSPGVSLERIRQMDPDLVLIDIDSAAMSGSTLRLLEALPASVIALADSPAPRWTADALATGINAILSRDVVLDELRLALQAAETGLVLLHPGLVSNSPLTVSADDREQPVDSGEALTPRERETLRLVSEGLGNREIARRLSISEHTVKFHVSSILAKLGAASRTEAVSQGIRNGLIPV